MMKLAYKSTASTIKSIFTRIKYSNTKKQTMSILPSSPLASSFFRHKPLLLLLSLVLLTSCASGGRVYKAYLGELRQPMQLSVLQGVKMIRTDWINRYIDAVRFTKVDDIPIENSDDFGAIEITPGFHDITVYFSWDLGTQRGLAPALVDYAASRETISRTLRFNARAGETYLVKAEPFFNDSYHDITTLSHVDFWVVDEDGYEIVSQEAGRYVPSS